MVKTPTALLGVQEAMKINVGEGIDIYVCPTCSKLFDKEKQLHIHHTKGHGWSIAFVERPCGWCGESVERHKSTADKHDLSFCDSDCRNNYTSDESVNPSKKVSVECATCGGPKEVYRYKSERYDRHFCNEECQNEWIKSNLFVSGPESLGWKGGSPGYYGPDWRKNRREALSRDTFECQHCHISREEHHSKYGTDLHVHHITPFREFDDHSDANELSNLITLCRDCHDLFEGTYLSPVHRDATTLG